MPRPNILAKAAFWTALLVASYFAVIPLPVPPASQPSDKFLHILAFATLAALGRFAFTRLDSYKLALALSLYGAGIEAAQAIPFLHRNAEFMDWVADTAAASIVLVAIFLLKGARRLIGSQRSLNRAGDA